MKSSFVHNPPDKINVRTLVLQGGIFMLIMATLCLASSILNTHNLKLEKEKKALRKKISTVPKQFKQKRGAKIHVLIKEEKIDFRIQKNILIILNRITSLLPASCKLNNINVSHNNIMISGLTHNALSLTHYTNILKKQVLLKKLSIGKMKQLPQSTLSSFTLTTNKDKESHE